MGSFSRSRRSKQTNNGMTCSISAQTQLRSDVANYKVQILDLARKNPYGTEDLTPFYNDKLKQLETIQSYLQQATMNCQGQSDSVTTMVPTDEERYFYPP